MIIDLNKELNMTLGEALFIAKQFDTIILAPKIYNEKITISQPNLTIIGTNGSTITWDDYSSKIIPINYGGDGTKTFGTTGSATFTVKESANGFHIKNVTIINSHKRDKLSGNQAVAFKSEIHNLLIEDCKFISRQDTLYIDNGINNRVINSYIEGDVDFIFGSADCVFYNCEIKGLKHTSDIYYTAPSTLAINDYGFIFKKCRFSTLNAVTYIGRAWFPGGAFQPLYPILSMIDCEFSGDTIFELIQMHEGDPLTKKVCLYNCKYNDKIISNIDDASVLNEYIESILNN